LVVVDDGALGLDDLVVKGSNGYIDHGGWDPSAESGRQQSVIV
jgi:hypothetical protein